MPKLKMHVIYFAGFYDIIAIVAGVVQTILYADFFYLYITKVCNSLLRKSIISNRLSGYMYSSVISLFLFFCFYCTLFFFCFLLHTFQFQFFPGYTGQDQNNCVGWNNFVGRFFFLFIYCTFLHSLVGKNVRVGKI